MPGYYDKVTRPQRSACAPKNERRALREVDADGLAVCIQHGWRPRREDFIDHLSPLKRARLTARARKKQQLVG